MLLIIFDLLINATFKHLKINSLFFLCQNQLILGVMGVDVSLEEIKKLTPRFTVSFPEYLFFNFCCSLDPLHVSFPGYLAPLPGNNK